MSSYLRVHAGYSAFLVPRAAVASVRSLTGAARPASGDTVLDRQMLIADFARLLQLPSSLPLNPVGLRLTCTPAAWLCAADRVERIENHPPDSLRNLPRALAPLDRWLAGVVADPGTGGLICVLREKPGLAPMAFLRQLRRAAIDPQSLREEDL
ncbi:MULTISPECIES: hypothetical protein [unclassified Pannonibacter]|uniref:hypothetical protein n=1 Tax=unclassified Pannonibacter TaxID=2627228 RepID=UPI0016484B09|nr:MULTISPECIES: hypothetical protein [unclassified Pannonibacter]